MTEHAGYEIVQVSINGTGPYNFVLDTGSSTTLVQQGLLDVLHVHGNRALLVHMATGSTNVHASTLHRIEIAGLGVEDLEVNTLDTDSLKALDTRVDGVLGENFLKHYDLLIDNQMHTLLLDSTSASAAGLTGERQRLFHAGSYGAQTTPDRMIVDVRLPSMRAKPLKFLLDTGTNTPMFFPAKGRGTLPQNTQMQGYAGKIACGLGRSDLAVGSSTLEGVELSQCDGLTRDKMDTDGLLPTTLFHQLFVSHKGAYVIVNPLAAVGSQQTLLQVALAR